MEFNLSYTFALVVASSLSPLYEPSSVQIHPSGRHRAQRRAMATQLTRENSTSAPNAPPSSHNHPTS